MVVLVGCSRRCVGTVVVLVGCGLLCWLVGSSGPSLVHMLQPMQKIEFAINATHLAHAMSIPHAAA